MEVWLLRKEITVHIEYQSFYPLVGMGWNMIHLMLLQFGWRSETQLGRTYITGVALSRPAVQIFLYNGGLSNALLISLLISKLFLYKGLYGWGGERDIVNSLRPAREGEGW